MLRILIIDDSLSDRLLAIRELKKAFADVEIQEAGEATEFAAAMETGGFDIVITDYQLHWSDGLTILQTVRSHYPDCPIIMFTDSGSEEIAVQGMKQGLSDYVLKGKPLYRLAIAVQEGLEKQRLRRENEQTLAQLKRSEEQLRRQAKELAESNQLKDEFLAVLSHELRTPLNPILGWVQMLRRGKLAPDRAAHALETIERNAKLQTQLIEDLLDISRILRGKLHLNTVPVNLIQTIEAALETVRLGAEAKQIQLNTQLGSGEIYVSGDPNRLQQIIWNLLANAIKFTPNGGQVEVKLERIEGIGTGNAVASHVSPPLRPSAQITISDTGKGICSEFLPHVFEYFRQADSSTTRNFGGLGLGLAIVHRLTLMHGGTVWAESPGEGQGATFTIRLPLMMHSLEPVDQITSAENSPDLRGIKVLVVDDEKDNLELIAFILETAGAKVCSVASAREALGEFSQFNPDILVSDIGMPGMDGYQLIQQIQSLFESGKTIPAIALTAYVGELNQQQVLAAGFRLHLPKPIDPNDLIAAVASLSH